MIDCPNPLCTGGYMTEIGRVTGVMGYEYEREIPCPDCEARANDGDEETGE